MIWINWVTIILLVQINVPNLEETMMASSILFFFSSLILFNFLGASISMDNCTTPSCNSAMDLFSVRFPFRLPEYQPNIGCGYSSNFTLSCSPRNQTLIHLLNAGSFAIHTIDYFFQKVTVTDPDRCLPRRFLNLDLSASPFSFSYRQNFTYYNCTEMEDSFYRSHFGVPCMSGKNYTVLVMYSGGLETGAMEMNCTVIKSVLAPLDPGMFDNPAMSVGLYWVEPNCRRCLPKVEVCGFKGGSNSVECKDTTIGLSPQAAKPGLSAQAKSVLALSIVFPGGLIMMVVAAYMCKLSERTEEEQINHPETGLMRTRPRTATAGLSETAIELNPMFVLGEGDVLLEPNISPCTICLCEYKLGDVLRTIQDCNHYFHSDCVDEWLRMKATCPVCRKGA